MGQQPNIELSDSDRPRTTPQPPAAARWRPVKPGLITTPEDVPSGGRFGSAGPDAGWGLRLLAGADLPDPDPRLRAILEGLMMARAAALGRAPIHEDIEAGLALCGYGYEAPPEILERRERWKVAVAHESRPGFAAAAEVGLDLLSLKPGEIRFSIGRTRGVETPG